jgi:uncharacterized membrane protein
MRFGIIATCLLFSLVTPTFAAENPPPDVKGLYLLTDYPAVSVRPGTTSNVTLQLKNYALAPARLALTLSGVPAGWTATLLGGGQPVAAAMPATNESVSLTLRLEVPKSAAIGSHTLTVNADGGSTHASLPIQVTLAKELPAKLSLQPQLPQLRGSSSASFEYTLSIKNDSGKKLLVSLAAEAPHNFDATFTEAYGSQELSAIPVDAGQSKDVKLKIRPPNTIGAGHYEVTAKIAAEDASASTKLGLDITGEAKLDLTGRGGLVSGRATAGKETAIPVVVSNTGTAPAEQITLSGSAPSGWKVTFEPKAIDRIAPNQSKEVQALITPTSNAIAGDYVTTLQAAARGESASSNFRITVSTSTLWGVAGVGIIGVALLVMVGAVARFGRR